MNINYIYDLYSYGENIMATVLVIGDPHFKVSNVRETDAMVEAIIRVANEKRPDFIVVLGDILDRHETIHVSPLTRSVKFLARLKDIAPTYVLIGNHDLKNNRQFLSDEHPFTSLKYWGPRMTIVDTTTMVNIKGQTFVFVPYVPPGRFVEALSRCNGWETATCIFAHQEFRGAKMGAIISTEGDEWPLLHPYVISGHIHNYHEPQINILYVGTPIQHAFGDHHDKTISYFTLNSPTYRDHERIDLGLPRKYIIRITCAEVSTYIPQHNSELKIIIRGTSGEIKATMKHPNIDIWKRAGHRIIYKDIPLERHNDDTPLISRAHMRFSIALHNAVNNNVRLGRLYNRIFGSVKESNSIVPITLNIEPLTNAMNNLNIPVPIPKVEVKESPSKCKLNIIQGPRASMTPIIIPQLTLTLTTNK